MKYCVWNTMLEKRDDETIGRHVYNNCPGSSTCGSDLLLLNIHPTENFKYDTQRIKNKIVMRIDYYYCNVNFCGH